MFFFKITMCFAVKKLHFVIFWLWTERKAIKFKQHPQNRFTTFFEIMWNGAAKPVTKPLETEKFYCGLISIVFGLFFQVVGSKSPFLGKKQEFVPHVLRQVVNLSCYFGFSGDGLFFWGNGIWGTKKWFQDLCSTGKTYTKTTKNIYLSSVW